MENFEHTRPNASTRANNRIMYVTVYVRTYWWYQAHTVVSPGECNYGFVITQVHTELFKNNF